MLGGYGDLIFQFGMFDETERDFFNLQCDSAVNYIKKKDFYSAFKVSCRLVVIAQTVSESALANSPRYLHTPE